MSTTDDDSPTTGAPILTIQRIYAKAAKPRKETLPLNYTVSDLAADQIMVRSRISAAQLVPVQGLVVPVSVSSTQPPQQQLPFYHTDLDRHGSSSLLDDHEKEMTGNKTQTTHTKPPKQYPLQRKDRIYEERGVLFQAREHYQQLMEHPVFSKLLLRQDDAVEDDDPRFGEQLMVSGLLCHSSNISIGDVFVVVPTTRNETSHNNNPLKIQVTSPRLPCAMVDKRNGSPFGTNGLKRHTMTHGLAGWFVRVLQAGDIVEGMELVRVAHPHPKWTLKYVSQTLYGQGDRKHMLLCRAQWAQSQEELKELCDLPELGWLDWKAEAQRLLDDWETNDSGYDSCVAALWYFVALLIIVVASMCYQDRSL